jgi:hypothetical protein
MGRSPGLVRLRRITPDMGAGGALKTMRGLKPPAYPKPET